VVGVPLRLPHREEVDSRVGVGLECAVWEELAPEGGGGEGARKAAEELAEGGAPGAWRGQRGQGAHASSHSNGCPLSMVAIGGVAGSGRPSNMLQAIPQAGYQLLGAALCGVAPSSVREGW
jgi:hypothetical protein